MALTVDTSFPDTQNFIPPSLEPKFSFARQVQGAVTLGAQESILLTGSHAAFHAIEGVRARIAGEEPLSKEQHNELFGERIPYKEGEFRAQAEMRNKYYETRDYSGYISKDMGMAASLGFGILGNSVDAPFMAIPGLNVLGKAKAFEHARRTGLSFKAAEEFVGRMGSLRTYGAALKASAAEQLVETQAVYTLSSYTGRDYGSEDRIMDFLFGTGVASLINIPLISKSKAIAREQGRILNDMHTMLDFFEHGDYAEGVLKMREYSSELGLSLQVRPEIQAILDKPRKERTPEDQAKVEEFFNEHMAEIELEQQRAAVQPDPDKPIVEAKAEVERNLDKISVNTEGPSRIKISGIYGRKGEASIRSLLSRYDRLTAILSDPDRMLDASSDPDQHTQRVAELFSERDAVEAELMWLGDQIQKEVDQAISTVRRIFGIPAVKGKTGSADMAFNSLGWVVKGSRKINIGTIRDWASTLDIGQKTVSQTVFHEAMHVFETTHPELYAKLIAAIERHPDLMRKLNAIIARKGYDPVKWRDERPSHLIEWAVAQPEFWRALRDYDPTLFGKFRQFVEWVYFKALHLMRGPDSSVVKITEADLRNMSTVELARRLGQFFNRVRQERPIDPKAVNQAAAKLDADRTRSREQKAREVREDEVRQHDRVVNESKGNTPGILSLPEALISFVKNYEFRPPPKPKDGSTSLPNPLTMNRPAGETSSSWLFADDIQAMWKEEKNRLYFEEAMAAKRAGRPPHYDRIDAMFNDWRRDIIKQHKAEHAGEPLPESIKDAFRALYEAERNAVMKAHGVSGNQWAEYGAFIDRLYLLRKWTDTTIASSETFFQGEVPVRIRSNINAFEDYNYFQYQVNIGKMSVAQARDAFVKKLADTLEARMRAEYNNFSAWIQFDHLIGKSKIEIIKYLKTVMDGRERRGVGTKDSSLETKVLAQMQEDQAAIRHALIKHGLYDLFTGVSTVSAESLQSRSLHTVSSETGQALYGKKLKEAHDLFWRDLMDGARRREVPENWKGVKPLEEVFAAYMATHERQRLLINELGANIAYREGFSGLSQRWDDGRILRYGESAWKGRMLEDIDWEATEAAHGGIMNVVTDETGAVTAYDRFNRVEFLRQWFNEIKTHERGDHPSEDIFASLTKHRRVVIKPDRELAVLMDFSGHTSPGILYMDQVRHRSELIAVGRTLGTRPLPNFRAISGRLGLDPEMTIKRALFDGHAVENLNLAHLQWTVKHLTGALDNPVDINLSQIGQGTRQVSNLAFLPLSGVSAVTDIPMIALRLQQQGLLKYEDMGRFMARYFQAHRRNFGSDRAMREALEAEGAGLDATINAASARIALGDPNNPSMLSKANDVMFTVNYLNGITRAGQEAYVDILTQGLAAQLAGDMDPLLAASLEAYGFTEADIQVLRDSRVAGVDGVLRVGPSSVQDPAVSRRLREFILQNMNEAVLLPDVGTQALLRFGTRAGTFSGEAVRNALQYTSFPLGMTRIITRKFMTTYSGTNAWTAHQTGKVQLIAFVGSMLAMGYMATVIKDILRGREPMSLTNMSAKGWQRVISQSGVAGILEQVFALGQGELRGALAPLPGTIIKAAHSGSAAEVVDDLRPFYGSTYPLIGPAVSQILGWAFGESLQHLQKRRKAILKSIYEQPRALDTE